MIWGVEASQLPSLCLMGKVYCCPSPQTEAQLTPVLPPRPWPSCVLYTVFRGAKPSSLHRNYVPCKTAASLIFYSPALEACGTLAEKLALLVPRENTARKFCGVIWPRYSLLQSLQSLTNRSAKLVLSFLHKRAFVAAIGILFLIQGILYFGTSKIRLKHPLSTFI